MSYKAKPGFFSGVGNVLFCTWYTLNTLFKLLPQSRNIFHSLKTWNTIQTNMLSTLWNSEMKWKGSWKWQPRMSKALEESKLILWKGTIVILLKFKSSFIKLENKIQITKTTIHFWNMTPRLLISNKISMYNFKQINEFFSYPYFNSKSLYYVLAASEIQVWFPKCKYLSYYNLSNVKWHKRKVILIILSQKFNTIF